MSIVESHDVLKLKGMLVEFETKMGKAAFVSHQWAQKDHPDPTFEQFSVFQAAMKKILNDLSHIPLLFAPEARVPGARPLSTKDMRSVKLFIWYDYFSCPQHLDLSDQSKLGATSQQPAIASSLHQGCNISLRPFVVRCERPPPCPVEGCEAFNGVCAWLGSCMMRRSRSWTASAAADELYLPVLDMPDLGYRLCSRTLPGAGLFHERSPWRGQLSHSTNNCTPSACRLSRERRHGHRCQQAARWRRGSSVAQGDHLPRGHELTSKRWWQRQPLYDATKHISIGAQKYGC